MTSFAALPSRRRRDAFLPRFLPVAIVTGLGLSAMGAPLSTLPRYVQTELGFGPVVVGLIMGLEPAATLLTRAACGKLSDRRGPKAGMLIGLAAAAFSGLAYLLPLVLPVSPLAALAILGVGRIAMGLAESLIFITAETWPIGLLGSEHAGRIVSWAGFAMFAGIAAGTGLGALLAEQLGLAATALSIMLLPAIGSAIAVAQPAAVSKAEAATLTFASALRRIWRACAGFALGTSGYAAANAFLSLTFDARHWVGGGLAVTLVGVGFVAARIVLGNVMDKLEGRRAMAAALATEALGLATVALAPMPIVALAGAIIAGFGYSLLYPQFAMPIIRTAPDGGLGVTMGAFTASYDVAMMVAPPACGAVAATAGLPAVFAVAAGVVLLALWPAALQRRALGRQTSASAFNAPGLA